MKEHDATSTGLMSGRDIIGEVTEAVKKYIKDGWVDEKNLTIEEQLDKTSMGKTDQFAFVYMYRLRIIQPQTGRISSSACANDVRTG